jgi:hypothetical protein
MESLKMWLPAFFTKSQDQEQEAAHAETFASVCLSVFYLDFEKLRQVRMDPT